ncbi:MAG: UDP-N-acetylmuramate dehydrogenase [Nitrospiraceae bacterium]|nr:UDP-N-acetylmuramate dehydrogenase [Nitrospiraceae bacterium]
MEIANFKGEIKLQEPLSRHTSYAIGGPADVFAYPLDRNDLIALLREIRGNGLRYFILGGGTNLLVRDGGFRGVVISLQRMQAVKIEREYRSIGGAFVVVSAEAGAPLSRLLSFAVEEGLTGLEFAAGIPGTVGGAVCMNAGTVAGEFGDVIDAVTLLSPGGELVIRGREEMAFGYRTCTIPDGHLVLDARIILRRDDKKKVQARVKELIDARKQRQPAGLPNAGSIFKNPHEESAGKLIETAGLKGKTVGNAKVSDKHANFIVNQGNAKASDVLALMELVKAKVLEVHGVRLEPEIKIIGED